LAKSVYSYIIMAIDKAEKLEKLRGLTDQFRHNFSQYTDKNYKEQRLRMDFVDKIFELFDWDISNKEGASEEFRDVEIEGNLEIAGAQKRPDYTFRIGNEPVFFVETKKPSLDLKGALEPAYQVRRYGYTAKRKISILTDFREFAIYDTRIKPGKNDKASIARLFYCTYDEYEKHWEFLYGLLSKEAVRKGSINNYAGSGAKRGSSEVDKDFLKLIETWRSELAKNIAKNNKKAEIDGINMAVQKIIDKILFLRICEEKGIEQFENLQTIAGDKRVYESLAAYFDKANKKYNSELFKPDAALNSLEIDDDILKEIIKGLYYPECPYAFSVLPVEILGNIYEQFLGKTIRLTESHLAKIEEKPEVRKAGGVYYTPKYIVDYIVKNTVGEKVKGATPKEIEKLKVLDPACGSGSFLLGAYTALLSHHLAYYTKKENLAKALKNEVIYPAKRDSYKLTIKEKQKILLNNIFGVDIDAQAVEVTRLSLMLKLLEGESDESAGKLFKYSETKLLPSLSNNIKCGNSLIGPDFYKDKNLSLFGNEDMKKINVFDWQKEFPEIFSAGGFDVVIGNPPYGALFGKDEVSYITKTYEMQNYQTDSYLLFLEKAHKLLNKNGLLGFIIPNTWLISLQYSSIRQYLINRTQIEKIIDYRMPVFREAVVDTQILLIRNLSPSKTHNIDIEINNKNGQTTKNNALQLDWIKLNGKPINIMQRKEDRGLLSKLNSFPVLDEICKITQGAKPFQVGKGVPPQTKQILEEKPFVSSERKNSSFRPLLRGSLMNRYVINWKNDYFIKFGDWLAEPRYSADYDAKAKIVVRQTGDSLVATIDESQFIVRDNLYTIVHKKPDVDLKYVLGLINSKLMNWYYQNILNPEKGEALAQVKRGHLAQLPINIANTKEAKMLPSLVDQMLETQEKAQSTKTESDKKHFQQKIEILDKQIDELVYELYGLTEEEVAMVEGGK
jgi:adenine-specific DNA-methyltransferase